MSRIYAAMRRWRLRAQLEQINYQLARIVLQREQDKLDEQLLQARQALIKHELANI